MEASGQAFRIGAGCAGLDAPLACVSDPSQLAQCNLFRLRAF